VQLARHDPVVVVPGQEDDPQIFKGTIRLRPYGGTSRRVLAFLNSATESAVQSTHGYSH